MLILLVLFINKHTIYICIYIFTGDIMVLIRAVGAGEYSSKKGKLTKFCIENGLREKAMIEIRKLRQQLTNEILLSVPNLNVDVNPE
jgi:ATP-dependent RNA helicase DHX37/DHR1